MRFPRVHPIVAERQAELAELCRRFHVARLEVFGSAARGDFDPARSDVDLLVEFEATASGRGFSQYFGFKEEAEALFGRNVDLVEAGAVRNPYFAESVNESRVLVYGEPVTSRPVGPTPPNVSKKRGAKAMAPSRESRKYLWDALQRLDGARRMTASRTFDDYLSDEMFRLAVERLLEIVGEALNQLSHHDPETAAQVPELRKIIGFRNVLAHGYEDIDDEEVWQVVVTDLPVLQGVLKRLLGEDEG